MKGIMFIVYNSCLLCITKENMIIYQKFFMTVEVDTL